MVAAGSRPPDDVLADALSRELPADRDALYRPSTTADADGLRALFTRAGFSAASVALERPSLVFDSFED